jgi:hypothetical protein
LLAFEVLDLRPFYRISFTELEPVPVGALPNPIAIRFLVAGEEVLLRTARNVRLLVPRSDEDVVATRG